MKEEVPKGGKVSVGSQKRSSMSHKGRAIRSTELSNAGLGAGSF
jgi:hypothetical protein